MLEVLTTEPGVQFYTGNFLDGTVLGKQGHVYRMGDGIALEPQKFPDAPNQAKFVSTRVDPGKPYRHAMIYRVSVAPKRRWLNLGAMGRAFSHGGTALLMLTIFLTTLAFAQFEVTLSLLTLWFRLESDRRTTLALSQWMLACRRRRWMAMKAMIACGMA